VEHCTYSLSMTVSAKRQDHQLRSPAAAAGCEYDSEVTEEIQHRITLSDGVVLVLLT